MESIEFLDLCRTVVAKDYAKDGVTAEDVWVVAYTKVADNKKVILALSSNLTKDGADFFECTSIHEEKLVIDAYKKADKQIISLKEAEEETLVYSKDSRTLNLDSYNWDKGFNTVSSILSHLASQLADDVSFSMEEQLTKKVPTIYVGGDMLKRGSQLLREEEKALLRAEGFNVYAPQDDKSINDKSAHTKESNANLATRIFNKDTDAMMDADILIFEVDNNNVGTSVEIGQWAMIHYLAKLDEFKDNEQIQELASKPIFFHTTDIRDTDIEESGINRSHSYNQYLVGALIEANPLGVMPFNELVDYLVKNHK